jgi:hypothetical protein
MISLISVLLSKKMIVFTTAGVLLMTAFSFMTASISSMVAGLVFPLQVTQLWNYFQLGHDMDVLIAGFVTRWTMLGLVKVADYFAQA